MTSFYYTSSTGEKVEVSKKHIETAIRIKKELQKNSPSFRCAWSTHRKMMEQEGFFDSENSERYRLFIKNHQMAMGELDSKEEYDLKATGSKLESIKHAVGELAFSKRELQLENRKLNKLKRELTLFGVIAEEVINLFDDKFDEKMFENTLRIIPETDNNKILVPFTDWHIGLTTSSFNYEIARNKVEKFTSEIIRYCKEFSVQEIYLAGLGDLVENVYMRTTQAKDAEFNFSEQIVKASELVISMISELSNHVYVNYLGIVMGNHDRMFIKGQTLENDSAMRIVDFCVTQFIESSKNPNVTIDKDGFDGLSIKTNINGFDIKMVHGDGESRNNSSKVKKHISIDGILYDMLIFGHFHHFGIFEENDGRICLNLGCLQGTTDYSKQLGYNTKPSQGIVLITSKELMPIRIGL